MNRFALVLSLAAAPRGGRCRAGAVLHELLPHLL